MLTVTLDRKLQYDDGSPDGVVDRYIPEMSSWHDYYSFGSVAEQGIFASDYRYGYQGSEKEPEQTTGAYSTEYRMLDTRIGRWFSPDMIEQSWQSPYTSMDNNPVVLNDIFGLSTGGEGGEENEDTPNGPPSFPDSKRRTPPKPNDEKEDKTSKESSFKVPGKGDNLQYHLPKGATVEEIFTTNTVKGQKTNNSIYVGQGSTKTVNYNGQKYTAKFDTKTGEFTNFTNNSGEKLLLYVEFDFEKAEEFIKNYDPEQGVSAMDIFGGKYVKIAWKALFKSSWKAVSKSSKILKFSAKQLQAKFKHAADFGVIGNYNKVNAAKFSAAINKHINSAGVVVINGTYKGQAAIHYLDASTGLNVIVKPSGEFWSGWKLSSDQLTNVLTHGGLN